MKYLLGCISLLVAAMVAAESKEFLNKPYSTYDQLIEIEFVVDHPLIEVWPYIVDTCAWITTFPMETVKGVRGKEGEIIKFSVLSGDKVAAEYFAEIVSVIKHKQVVMKYLQPEVFVRNTVTLYGYDIYELESHGEQTKVIFRTFQEYRSANILNDDFISMMKAGELQVGMMWKNDYIPRLKRLLKTVS